MTNHHHHHHRFNVRLSTLERVGQFPKMPPLHTALYCAYSCFSINFFMSSATHSFQVFLPLPPPLFPSTSIFLHADTHHLYLYAPRVQTILISPSVLCLSRSSSLEFLSFSVTPHIHLIIILCALSSLCMCSAFIAHVSLPYIITHWTH